MKKPVKQTPQRSAFAANIDDLVASVPTLAEFMAATAYEGEEPGTRLLPSLLIFCQDGMWKAMLKDKQEGRCLWASCNSLLEVFSLMNDALDSSDSVWRDDRAAGAEQARRQQPPKKS